MSLIIYGSPKSRTMRVLWMAAELGLEFEHRPLEYDAPELKQPDFLALNPSGAIPTIVDGDFALSESLAINLYLAKKYHARAPSLYPDSLEVEATILRWSLWAQGHLEPWVQKDLILVDLIQAIGNHGDAMVNYSLNTLNSVLADNLWLVTENFTVGDLNVAAVLSPSRASQLNMRDYPHVSDWLSRCYARPAAIQARQRYQSR
ncbi:MAG: glutathione S-transferase family protein [Pseudomonadota bacterium]